MTLGWLQSTIQWPLNNVYMAIGLYAIFKCRPTLPHINLDTIKVNSDGHRPNTLHMVYA